LTYSRLERLHFKLFGRWPQSVVDRRLAALDRDALDAQIRGRIAVAEHLRGRKA
jgi:hypothetical protein